MMIYRVSQILSNQASYLDCTYVSNQSLRFGVMDTHGAHNNLKQAYLQPFVQLVKTLIAPLERVFGKS